MKVILRLAAVALAFSLAAPRPVAAAADRPRISVGGIRGDDGRALLAQLEAAVCGRLECVPKARVSRQGRIEFKAVEREGVAGVLFGTVSRRRKILELALLTRSLTPERGWSLPLTSRGLVQPEALAGFAVELEGAVRGRVEAKRAPAPAPPKPPASAERATPAPAPVPMAAPEAPAAPAPVLPSEERAVAAAPRALEPRATRAPATSQPAEPRPGRAPAPTEPRTTGARAAPVERPGPADRPWAVVDLGTRAARRELSYGGVGVTSGGLRPFSGGLFYSPQARLELRPLAGMAGGSVRELGVFAAYARSVGFGATEAVTARRHDVTFSELEVGLSYPLRPFASPVLELSPRLSYRRTSCVVEPVGGVRVTGLPDTNLAGVVLGVDAEIALSRRFGLLLGGGYTYWLTAEDLVGTAGYFRDGGAWAVDGEAGAQVRLGRRYALRLVGTYGRTTYTLKRSAQYAATSATEAYVGGRGVLRVEL